MRPDGEEFEHDDWAQPDAHVLGMLIQGEATDEPGDRGRPVVGRTHPAAPERRHPLALLRAAQPDEAGSWVEMLNTARPGTRPVRTPGVNLVAHSLILLAFTNDGQQPLTP